MSRSWMFAALGAALLASCRSFEFEGQQVLLRYQPETDVLDALVVYEGVGANKENEVEQDAERLARIARGRRHFVVFDWIMDFDLDALVEKLDPGDPFDQRLDLFISDVRLLGAGFARTPDGELCLLQRVRIANATAGLRLLDQAVARLILEAVAEEADGSGSFTEDFTDPRTAELWLRRAHARGAWLRFDGDTLEVSLPTTPRDAAATLARLFAKADENSASLARALTSIQISGEEALLAFAPDEDGWIRFSFAFSDRHSVPVTEVLADGGRTQELPPLVDEIARLLALE